MDVRKICITYCKRPSDVVRFEDQPIRFGCAPLIYNVEVPTWECAITFLNQLLSDRTVRVESVVDYTNSGGEHETKS